MPDSKPLVRDEQVGSVDTLNVRSDSVRIQLRNVSNMTVTWTQKPDPTLHDPLGELDSLVLDTGAQRLEFYGHRGEIEAFIRKLSRFNIRGY